MTKKSWAKIMIRKSLAIKGWASGSLATTPGAIIGAIKLAKMMISMENRMKTKTPKVIIVEENVQALSNLSRDKNFENIGIKAKAMVPKIKTSKIASGTIEAAM